MTDMAEKHSDAKRNIGRFWRGGVLAASLALLSACQTILPSGELPPPTVEAPPPSSEVAGPVTVGIPQDQTHHRIALLVPLTGRNAGIGKSLQNATTMALLDTQASNIRITAYDTATGAEAAARRAVADGNKLILGPLLGDDVNATAKVAGPAGVPLLSFSNDASVASSNVFLLGHLPAQSVERVVRYSYDKGMRRFAALIPNNVYGERALTALTDTVRGLRGAVLVSTQRYEPNSASIDAATKKLSANGAFDAVLVADNGRLAIQAAPYLRRNGAGTARFLGTELWNTSANLAGDPTMNGAWFASVSDGLYRQYATKYRARYGDNPFRLSSMGYDAVLLSVKVARNWQVGTAFPIQQLADPGGFGGLDGVFRFKPDGRSERALEVQEIQRGNFAVIDQAPKAF